MGAGAKLLTKGEANKAVETLFSHYGKVKYYLDFDGPLQLMVAAILSAQTRDETVNKITPALFAKYKSAKDFSKATESDLIRYIKSVSYAGNKALNIIAACKELVSQYGGNVPDDMDSLVALPGIGRKTANTILINGFGKVEGIPVDTWVMKLSYRIGISLAKSPEAVERDLMEKLDRKHWPKVAYLLKMHGKELCGKKPLCEKCPIARICPKNGV
ncbi:MAG: endonuclease III [Candidatus Marsarchaeota archaeon]|nr:endonuclease III [Candidatus Marsarchaeota archaeon]MCL5007617.1 endonuclease III [Candidatus Marsarchaeota archaeon]